MKKFVLCGATHGSNFGDTIFAMMFYTLLSQKYPKYEFRFTELSEHTKKYIDAKEADENYLANADGLIFISGGFFGEAQKESIRGSLKRYSKYIKYGNKFVRKNQPICISGVGAGPLNNKILRGMAVKIFNFASFVSVRDNESKEYMISYGVKNDIKVTTDSAICINKFSFKKEDDVQLDRLKERNNLVLIHVSEAIDFSFYNEKVLEPLRKSLSKNINIVIANDVEGNESLLRKAEEVFSEFQPRVYKYTDPIQFLELLKTVDAVITPKLHVGIFASTFEKSVISFPLHPEKTLRFYNQIGYPENTRSLFEVTENEIKEMVNKNLHNKIIVKESIIAKSEYNFKLVCEFIDTL